MSGLSEEAATVPPGCDGVLWAPYLMGERTPHLDPQARAALVGLAANHGRGHIIRAILEGVAFSLRDTFTIFEEMKVPVNQHPPRRRRRALAVVAADPGRRLRHAGRSRRGGRRRGLRSGVAGGSRRRNLVERR